MVLFIIIDENKSLIIDSNELLLELYILTMYFQFK